MEQSFSIIIPAFNEESSIKEVLINLKKYLRTNDYQSEIIVVNDGSTDQTLEILKKIKKINLINHPYNKGYGAALKTGVKNSKYDWILFYGGDNQHNPKYIPELLKYTQDYDMIIGARQGYQGPFLRQPGKKFLHWMAEYLVQNKIPDLNSGLRLINKSLFNKFKHILPNGFSLSTTITLAAFRENFNVKYISIKINKRNGKSTVKPKDAFVTLMLILRIITLFSPLRIFLPISFIFGLAALVSLIYDITKTNITDITVIFLFCAIMLFFFGLLADQIAAIRRHIK